MVAAFKELPLKKTMLGLWTSKNRGKLAARSRHKIILEQIQKSSSKSEHFSFQIEVW